MTLTQTVCTISVTWHCVTISPVNCSLLSTLARVSLCLVLRQDWHINNAHAHPDRQLQPQQTDQDTAAKMQHVPGVFLARCGVCHLVCLINY